MNDKDKEAFDGWLENTTTTQEEIEAYEAMNEKDRVMFCMKYTWQAACEYKQRDIESLEKEQVTHIEILQDEMGQIIKDREWEVNYLSKRTKSLESENKKLRVALESIKYQITSWNINESIIIERILILAREALKEVGEK